MPPRDLTRLRFDQLEIGMFHGSVLIGLSGPVGLMTGIRATCKDIMAAKTIPDEELPCQKFIEIHDYVGYDCHSSQLLLAFIGFIPPGHQCSRGGI